MQNPIIEREVQAGTAERNNMIRAMVKTGRSQASIAREYEISEARVSQIVNRGKRSFWSILWKKVRRR